MSKTSLNERNLYKLKGNAFFGKTMENVRKHRRINLLTTEKRRIYLVSEPKFYTKNDYQRI